MACKRNPRRSPRCGESAAAGITAGRVRSNACESVAAELYGVENTDINLVACRDRICGCRRIDRRRRCGFWPSFAHPRWLSCSELYDRRVR